MIKARNGQPVAEGDWLIDGKSIYCIDEVFRNGVDVHEIQFMHDGSEWHSDVTQRKTKREVRECEVI